MFLQFHFASKGKTFSAVNLSQVQIGSLFFRQIALGEYVLNSIASSFSGSIDVDLLVAEVLSKGFVASTDTVKNVRIVNTVDWGTGQANLNHSLAFTKQAAFVSKTLAILSENYVMELVPNNRTSTAADYLNLTMPLAPSSITDLSFDYYQLTPIYNVRTVNI